MEWNVARIEVHWGGRKGGIRDSSLVLPPSKAARGLQIGLSPGFFPRGLPFPSAWVPVSLSHRYFKALSCLAGSSLVNITIGYIG